MKANPVMHFQVPVEDMGRAQGFYEKVFGWRLEAPPGMEGQYHMAITVPSGECGPTEPGGINGALARRCEENPYQAWLVIGVDSIDEHVKKVEAAGGRLVTGKASVMGMGFYAQVEDTEGNVVGLWESAG